MDIFSYGTPESAGLSSKAVAKVYRKLVDLKFMSHSLVVARRGKVVSEGYFAPFEKDEFHRMYSTSKSFTATAIGMLAGEGRLALDDKVVKYFPEKVTAATHPYIKEMTIRNLLTMTSPFDRVTYSPNRDDWVDSYFTTPPAHPAGTHFYYDTSASFILNVIVEKLTGMPYMEYLSRTLFRGTDFSEGTWCIQSPDGWSWGGSGVQCTVLDLARLGQVYLQKGVVNGEQRLPRDFAEAAVSRQVDNNTSGHFGFDDGCGYGYQIWCGHDGCFCFLGMGGQVVYACPKTGLLLAATSDEQGHSHGYRMLSELFYSLRDSLLESGTPDSLPEDPEAYAGLTALLRSLKIPLTVTGKNASPLEAEVFGKTFTAFSDPAAITPTLAVDSIRVTRDGGRGALFFSRNGEEKCIPFGFGEYVQHEFPEKGYFGRRIREPKGDGYRTFSAGLWTQPDKLCIRSCLADWYFGNLTVTLSFTSPDTVTVLMSKTAEWFLDEYNGWTVLKA